MFERQELVIGKEGQQKIKNSKVAIIGVGALGTVAAELLVRSGIGSLSLVDRDVIEESNLQRQTLFDLDNVGKSKAVVAKEKLLKINRDIEIESKAIHLDNKNINALDEYDLILDCTDNLKTRFLINECCKKNSKKWIYAAAIKTSGYVMPILPNGPCLSCFVKENGSLDTCDTAGVINPITTSIAALQVSIALKILVGEEVDSTLYYYDIWNTNFKKLNVIKDEECSTCKGEYTNLEENQEEVIRFCATGKFQVQGKPINREEIKEKLQRIGGVKDDGVTLTFKNIILFDDGRALIDANTKEEALSSYSKWIGN